ncbi:MAG: IS3 family transposase [SAR324 cluster bacterium]|nr:IS3 family transposase [SAR324 cluster bacterium]
MVTIVGSRTQQVKRGRQDQILKTEVLRVFTKHKRIYGSPRLSAKLKKVGIFAGENRVTRLMREMGLRSIIQRKYKATTNSKHNKPVATNRLNRKFRPSRLNQAWAGDITYIQTKQGRLYLAIVMDLYSRHWLGMSDRINTNLVMRALESALAQRTQYRGMLFHSDRGVQYASENYQALLTQKVIVNSMSRKGNCWDNAVVESFLHSLSKSGYITEIL